jgi:hypothetical protein
MNGASQLSVEITIIDHVLSQSLLNSEIFVSQIQTIDILCPCIMPTELLEERKVVDS